MKYAIRRVDPKEYVTDIKRLHAFLPGSPLYLWWTEWWVAFDQDGNAVAYAAMRPARNHDRGGYLAAAVVHPEHRGQGLQRRLILARERRARKLGFTQLITYTRAFNYRSSNNMIASGFRMYMPNKPWGKRDALYWRKDIAASRRARKQPR